MHIRKKLQDLVESGVLRSMDPFELKQVRSADTALAEVARQNVYLRDEEESSWTPSIFHSAISLHRGQACVSNLHSPYT